MTRGVVAGAAGLVLAVSGAYAADPVDSAETSDLAPVVVTATRSAQPAFDVPASVDAIALDPSTPDSPGINPGEYLNAVPGVSARDRQNYAQDEQLSIRGFGARSSFGVRGVRLYVDGIPATMPDGQGQVSNFPLDAAERIEVLRGPFSALYGNSSGGVVQIFTTPGQAGDPWRGTLTGGSYGTYRVAADARGGGDAFRYNVDFSHFYTDDYRAHARAERDNGNARLDFVLGEGRHLSVLANTVALPNADDPLGLTRSQFDADPRQPQPAAVQFDTRKSVHQAQLGAVYEQTLTDAQDLRVMAYGGTRAVDQFQSIPPATQAKPTSPGGVIALDGNFDGVDARWTWHGTLAARPFEVVAGTSYDRQDVHRFGYNNFDGGTLGVKGTLRRDEQDDVYNVDEYVQANWDVAERWLVNAGVRHSDVRFSVDDHYVTANNADDSSRTAYGANTPVAGVLFRASDTWHLYAAYGNAFETPTFNELGYRPDGSAGVNFALVPARSRNGEIGSKWRGGAAEFDVAVFQANTRNELAVDTSSGGRTTYQNVGRARRRGAEAKLALPLAPHWRIDAAATALDATFRTPFLTCPAASPCTTPNTLVAAGARIPGVPRRFGQASLRYDADAHWYAALEGNAASRTPVNDLNTDAAAGYATLDLVGGHTFTRGHARIATFLRLNNLGDRHYAGSVIVNENNGRYFEPAMGRNVFGGMTVSWERR